ncbi:MAG: DEAD/DEAH box helicase [Spirochaetales bacterium]|nr:DEAD/DEAH box helicase [Spirochaetales bacterium]
MDSQDHDRPIIVQSDKTILLEVHSPDFNKARNAISLFAELVKSPEHVHTFRLSPLSLWNAASSGTNANEIEETLQYWSRYPVPESILFNIQDTISKYGLISLHKVFNDEKYLYLHIPTKKLHLECKSRSRIKDLLLPLPDTITTSSQIQNFKPDVDIQYGFFIHLYNRGELKLQLIKTGYPVDDLVPLKEGARLEISFKKTTSSGYPFILRNYQKEACEAFTGNGTSGFGTLVLPCGSGKTIIGMAAMEALKTNTLIVTTNIAAVHQWIYELLDKTNLTREQIGEYTGDRKEVLPITVCTYQILTWRKNKDSEFPHLSIFRERDWGLIMYDEVHVLPAPVFKVTAEIQAISRLGLTATLIREDNREDEVFSLVGPKRYDVPWKELEQKGWIAEAHCYEIRIPLHQSLELDYAIGSKRQKYRIASENPIKTQVVKQLIENHKEDYILIIGQYLAQLSKLAKELDMPLITGATPNKRREELFNKFRKKEQRILIVSKVANFAIDLPDASVAIQISGTFGSRQEEAQRLGRILRPKKHGSYFYSLITRYTSEEEFAANRQKFLAEQGYKYHIEIWD